MISIIFCEQGEGFAFQVKSLLTGARTLYIGPKNSCKAYARVWSDLRVSYSSFYKFEYEIKNFDQILIEGCSLNFRTKRTRNLLDYLSTSPTTPVYFRYYNSVEDVIKLNELRAGK
jgi:hypothetical protein